MIHPNNWTEKALYEGGWHAIKTFYCNECEDEVTVYESYRTPKRLFLMSSMEVHPHHERSDEV